MNTQPETLPIDATAFYRQVLAFTPDPSLIVDLLGKVLDVSEHSLPLLGYTSRDSLLGSSLFDLLVPDDALRAREHFAQILEGKFLGSQEYAAYHKKDGVFWLEINGMVIRHLQEEPQAVFMACRDITSRKKTEFALKKSETHYRTLIESARSPILHMSPDGHILFMNTYAEDFFGFAPGELIGKHVVGTIVPEVESMTNRDLRQMIEDIFHDIKNYRININENIRKNGERVWIAWSNGAIFDAEGRLMEVCSVGTDVTEQRNARESLEAAHQQLQTQYAEIHELQAQLQDQVTRDPLTNLFNRRYLDDTFDRELARCNRENMPIAIVIMDIDFFKNINDNHGHEAGDMVLQSTALLLQELTRSEDIVCRYGGEEFLAVLPGASLEHAIERAENWRQTFASIDFEYKGKIIKTTMSCGVSAFPVHANDQDILIRLADDALYLAKANGRNQVRAAGGLLQE